MGDKDDNSKILDRGNWSGKLDFIMSCIGFSVGLGNIWRFPYLCYKNGGGAFLIPYVLMLFLSGLPMYFFEMGFGQFASLGPIAIWNISPMFKGIGMGMVAITAMICIYYNVVITYAMFYLLVSLISLGGTLPWTTCDNHWNSEYCLTEPLPFIDTLPAVEQLNASLRTMNKTCIDEGMSSMGLNMKDLTYNLTLSNLSSCSLKDRYMLPSEEYFNRYVLQLHEAENFSDIGGVNLKLVFVLGISWVLLFFCLLRGIKTSGKVVYFLAIFPYVILIALLARGLTLEGYMEGIKFYIIPEWERLKDIDVWRQAATQIFYSLGLAFGTIITMASFNSFHHNCQRDAIIVALINCCTSIFAGFIIFAVMGFMAHATNRSVQDVAVDGPGLVFVVYPEGLSHMPGAPIWAFLFFSMFLSVGLDSQFAMFETVISSLIDLYPEYLRPRRIKFAILIHFIAFVCGIPLVTKGGIWVLTLMEWYSASLSLMIMAFLELTVIVWIYGINNFLGDVELMLGSKLSPYWKLSWACIAPIAVLLTLIMSIIKSTPASYGDYKFEDWVQGIGWFMTAVPLVLFIVPIPFQIYRYGSIKNAIRPSPEWGPAKPEDRIGKYAKSSAEGNDDVKYMTELDLVTPGQINGGYQGERL